MMLVEGVSHFTENPYFTIFDLVNMTSYFSSMYLVWTPVSVIKYDKIITADSTIINKDVLSWKYVLFCTNRLN